MDEIDRLVEAVAGSPKYKYVSADVIRSVGLRELARRSSLREAVKATKSRLHQVGAAYLSGRVQYAVWLDQLRVAAQCADRAHLLQVCRKAMQCHSSTRERLPILEQFYTATLADLPPIRSVLDVACGLNPLAIPWMPLSENAEYYAYDMYTDMVSFLNAFMSIVGVHGQALARDIVQSPPRRAADLALILKSLPCIEQLDAAAGARLLDALNVEHVLISFPVRSLGGADRGMLLNYETRFWELMRDRTWSARRFEFETELAFLVAKSTP